MSKTTLSKKLNSVASDLHSALGMPVAMSIDRWSTPKELKKLIVQRTKEGMSLKKYKAFSLNSGGLAIFMKRK